MRRTGALWVVLLAITLAFPATASSQTPPVSDSTAGASGSHGVASAATRLSASADPLAAFQPVGQHEPFLEQQAQPSVTLPQSRARNRKGVPFMVAGGILFVAGAIIGHDGGTLLMLGGAGIGAYGACIYTGG